MIRWIDCRGPHCDGGRIVHGHSNDPSPPDYGPCPICNGTGTEEIEDEPITLDDLCVTECQQAKDVGMPEYHCVGECQYRLARRQYDTEMSREHGPDLIRER